MTPRVRALQVLSVAWAVAGLMVAVGALVSVPDSAPALLWLASVGFPACAVGAAVALGRCRARTAGILLLLSVGTPTYFAYVLNVPALVAGFALLAGGSATLGPCCSQSGSGKASRAATSRWRSGDGGGLR